MSELDYRFSKVDEAIQRLANIAGDLSKLLAVQEQRIIYQERAHESMLVSLEKRRVEIDKKLEDIYDTVKEEITESRKHSCKQHEEQNLKITRLERIMWMAAGGGAVLGWILSYGMQAWRLFGNH
jgi:ABC-type uncharacterized transport system permease subunit